MNSTQSAVERNINSKFYLLSSTIVAALGGLLFGFDTAVISGTTNQLQHVFSLNEFWLGFTVAIALIGTIVGSISSGKPGEKYGRRNVMIVLALLFAISALGSGLTHNWYLFLIYRFIGGLGVGGASVISPMYIAEIAPARLRGRLVAVQQFNIVLGILVAFFSNYFISKLIADSLAWRWMFAVETVPAVLFMILLFFIPESPRWLIKYGRMDEARDILYKTGEQEVDRQVDEIIESLETPQKQQEEKFFSSKYKVPIITAMAIAIFNQLTGINAILYYAPRIFQMTGLSMDASLLQTIAVGITNMIFTVIAMTIIDRIGRKKLLLIGSVGMFITLGLVAQSFYFQNFDGYSVMLYLIGFIAFFAVSQGAVIWVYISEIFPNMVRSEGQSLGTFTHWVMNAVVAWSFPVMASSLGGGNSFMFFSLMMVLQFFFVFKFVPETKGKSLEQIQKDLNIQ